jgi:hypothetical protein
VVFFDIEIGGAPAGRIEMTVRRSTRAMRCARDDDDDDDDVDAMIDDLIGFDDVLFPTAD